MVTADHPNVIRGGVCAYIRESLPARNFSDSDLTNKRASLLYIDL